MAGPQRSVDDIVQELRRVPKEQVEEVMADFVSEGSASVEKVVESDGTFTVRAHFPGRQTKVSSHR
jgi:hypothetical protein